MPQICFLNTGHLTSPQGIQICPGGVPLLFWLTETKTKVLIVAKKKVKLQEWE